MWRERAEDERLAVERVRPGVAVAAGRARHPAVHERRARRRLLPALDVEPGREHPRNAFECGDHAGERTGGIASSTKRQSAFTSRISSTVLQSASSRRGEQTSSTRHCAREVATLIRFAVEDEREPARRVLPARARERDDHDRRLLPLELVDRADAHARRARAAAARAPARCTASRRGRPRRRAAASRRSRPCTPSRAAPRSRRATSSASSRESWPFAACSTGRKTSPFPAATLRRAHDVRALEPARVVRLRRERGQLRAQAPRVARGRSRGRAAPSSRRRAGAGARTPSPRPASRPARPAAAGSGRRGRRGCARRGRPRRRRRARPGPPRRRSACRGSPRSPRARRATTCPRRAGAPRRAGRASRRSSR